MLAREAGRSISVIVDLDIVGNMLNFLFQHIDSPHRCVNCGTDSGPHCVCVN